MKTDARTRYTLEMIKRALLSLLSEKSIEKVTVREICRLAEINRTTFYRHYDNQYALLAELQDAMLDEIRQSIALRRPDTGELLHMMFGLVYRNREQWLILLGENADPRISKRIIALIAEYFDVDSKSESGKMRYRFILSGASGIFEHWIATGLSAPPETMAAYVDEYISLLSAPPHSPALH